MAAKHHTTVRLEVVVDLRGVHFGDLEPDEVADFLIGEIGGLIPARSRAVVTNVDVDGEPFLRDRKRCAPASAASPQKGGA